MSASFLRGFTVIELMLFLAVTGVLFAALMVGVQMNITQQRYKEGVLNMTTVFQNQYSEVDNTRNDRDINWNCAGGNVVRDTTAGTARGTTDCVLLGRAIRVIENGTAVRTQSVVGVEPTGELAGGDLDALIQYGPKLVTAGDSTIAFGESTFSMDWGSSLKTPENQNSEASVLILRSPVSGLIRVFSSVNPLPTDLTEMITPEAATNRLKLCVDGATGSLPAQSINIDPRIAGSDGITVNQVDSACN